MKSYFFQAKRTTTKGRRSAKFRWEYLRQFAAENEFTPIKFQRRTSPGLAQIEKRRRSVDFIFDSDLIYEGWLILFLTVT